MSAALRISDELVTIERTKRVEKPWLYRLGDGSEGVGVSHRLPVGVPMAVKIGLAIGQARRRDQLASARAQADAAFHYGLIDAEAHGAIGDAAKVKESSLA